MPFQSEQFIDLLRGHDRHPTTDLYAEIGVILEKMSGNLERRSAPQEVIDGLEEAVPKLLNAAPHKNVTYQYIFQCVNTFPTKFGENMELGGNRHRFFALLRAIELIDRDAAKHGTQIDRNVLDSFENRLRLI